MFNLNYLLVLISAIIAVESGGDLKAFNKDENAVGILQIRPIYVADVNRILDLIDPAAEKYTLDDRRDKAKSIEMFKIYTSYYYSRYFVEIEALGMSEFEAKARMHNGGPRGWQKSSTNKYWKDVEKEL